ncbi:MAG TPA: hypothetical protein PKK06_11150 [Phycisphaerae bacterium]|nr:hypothetical protein [Phycisphaerae bacterium]HNU44372.1 hypothetical protein [Phycisphaerae bacterium]
MALAAVVVIVASSSAWGTPFTWGEDEEGDTIAPLRWPAGSTINIYIEADPDPAPPDRSALLREGMLRWQAEMANRGITINVTVGDPPNPPPANVVRCTWEPNGTQRGGHTLGTGAGQDDGIGTCSGDTELDGGEIVIRDGLPAGTDAERDYIRNLGQHEVTHVLGLADDEDGQVTDHTQGTTPNTYNDTDRAEISSLYPVQEQQPAQGTGETEQSSNPNRYDWDFYYDGPPGGHVALITMEVPGEVISQIIPPPGWIALNPGDPGRLSLSYPFYQGYCEDGAPGRPPWDANYRVPLAFRALSAAASLSMGHPSVHVTLFTVGAQRGPMRAWAGGPEQVLEGPVAPSPSVPALGLIGWVAMGGALVGSGAVVCRRLGAEGRRRRESRAA